MRFTLDTNVLVYAIDSEAGPRHRVALDLLGRCRGEDCVLTLQALAELFGTLIGPKIKLPAVQATGLVRSLADAFPIVAADRPALDAAMEAVVRHKLSFWDAMMWATAMRHGCRYFVSEDGQSGRTLGNLTVVNPFAPDAGRFLDLILSPPD